jgi:O-antigen ligase
MPKFPSSVQASRHSATSKSSFDRAAFVPIMALAYSTIIQPLIYFNFPPPPGLEGMLESRIENRIFWPVLACIAVLLASQNWSKISRLSLPPNIASLAACIAFAGTSVAWAFNPELTFIRFVQEVMVLTSIIVPALLARRNSDLMRGVFLCFAFGSVVNVLLIPGGYTSVAQDGAKMIEIGYRGYFTGKNLLGEFAAIACLLSAHELLYGGRRRLFGIVVAVLAGVLLVLSSSKTALALVLLSPVLAGFLLIAGRAGRASPAIIMSVIAFICVMFCKLTDFDTGRIAYFMTGDSSFTGRTTIWNFAESEISLSPLLGWGYQSFWLAGPDAPSIVDAPGWVKSMPNAHSGYYDILLELGYVGLFLLTIFLVTNLQVIGHVAKRDAKRAWLLLSIALFVMLYNFLETLWLRAFDLSWVVFVIVAAEAARHWQPFQTRGAPHAAGHERPAGRWRGGSKPRLRTHP